MTTPRTLLFAVAGIVALFLLERCAEASGRAEARTDQQLDSLAGVVTRALQAQRAAIARADALDQLATRQSRRVAQLRDSAARLEARTIPAFPVYVRVPTRAVDSLPRIRFAGDTTSYPVPPRVLAALDSLTARTVAQAAELATRRTLDSATASLDTSRVATTDALRDGLAHADTAAAASAQRTGILERERTCRWLWVMPCLSRTEALVAGVAIGAAASLTLTKR